MKIDHLLDEIQDANLSYLILAQNMIRADRAAVDSPSGLLAQL